MRSRPFCKAFVFAVRDLALQIGRQWDFPVSLNAALARDAAASRAPLAGLVNACGIASRLRMLVDAGRYARDDVLLAVGGDARITSCFESLGAKVGERA